MPFLEVKPAYDELRVAFDTAYRRMMDSGWYVLGKATWLAASYASAIPVRVEPDPSYGVGIALLMHLEFLLSHPRALIRGTAAPDPASAPCVWQISLKCC